MKKTFISIVVLIVVVVGIIFLARSPKTSPSDQTMEEVSLEANQLEALNEVEELMMMNLTEGEGVEIQDGQTAVVHYIGTLVDGTVFDSSLTRGEAFEFTLGAGQVIQGWDIGVRGMKVGEQRRLIVPPTYGYGNRVVGPIPANSVLVFDVELLEIK